MKKKKMITAAMPAALTALTALAVFSACSMVEEGSVEGSDALPAEATVSLTDYRPPEPTDTEPSETTESTESTLTEPTESVSESTAEEIEETSSENERDTYENNDDGGEEKVPITDITLTYYSVTLEAGENSMPIVTMYPEDAPDKSEIWTSSDESVATVDRRGDITAVSRGDCIITVRSAVSPDIYAKVEVTVTASDNGSSEGGSAAETEPQPERVGLTYVNGILIANKTYRLPSDYNPGVNPEAQAAFDEMQAAAAEEGLNIYISSGFRSYDYQAGLYQRYVERSGKAEADRYSARPGYSEHQTGLAFDLNSIDISFADTDEYVWVRNHCADYGFIIRYPEDGEEITGYMYEPWHIRYLGKDTARKVYDSGLTLEEYLGITSKYAE